MPRKSASNFFALIALAVCSATAAADEAVCVPVSGKIVNNATSATSTLGVVAMVYGKRPNEVKLKCALSGAAQAAPPNIAFIHTISCDDSLQMPLGDTGATVPVHSSIVLYTTGTVLPPRLPTQLFTFQEVSVPILEAPARGRFEGVTGGQILVEGAFYISPDGVTPGSIDMEFSGNICY